MELSHVVPCIDCHVAGSPVRVLTGGLPRMRGESARQLAEDMRSRFDWLRTAALLEPRGASSLIGAASFHTGGDEGQYEAVFLDASGYPEASVNGALGLVTVMHSTGALSGVDRLTLRAPAEELSCRVETGGEVSVAVPVRLSEKDAGGVRVLCGQSDVMHCIVRAEDVGVTFDAGTFSALIAQSQAIRERLDPRPRAVSSWWEEGRRLVTVSEAGTIARGPDGGAAAVVAAASGFDGEFRGPAGLSVGARVTGDVVEIRARGRIISLNYLVVDPEDPVKSGFILG